MEPVNRLKPMADRLKEMKQAAVALKEMGREFPALFRNCDRILASIRMLEINVSDMVDEKSQNSSDRDR